MASIWSVQKSRAWLRRASTSSSKESTTFIATIKDPPPPIPPLPPLPKRASSLLLKRHSLPSSPLAAAAAPVTLSLSQARGELSRSFSDASPSPKRFSRRLVISHDSTSKQSIGDVDTTDGKTLTAPYQTTVQNGTTPRPASLGSSVHPLINNQTSNPEIPYSSYSTPLPSPCPLRKPPSPPASPNPRKRAVSFNSAASKSPGLGNISNSQYHTIPRSAGSDIGSPRSSHHESCTPTPLRSTSPPAPTLKRSSSIKILRQSLPFQSPSASPISSSFPLKRPTGSASSASLANFHKLRYHQQLQFEPPTPLRGRKSTNNIALRNPSPPRSKSLSKGLRKSTSMAFHANGSMGSTVGQVGVGSGVIPQNPNSPQALYQHIVETTAKRISTLDYLRKSHESRVYWFNTLQFSRPDILKLPSYSPPKLARRAHNFLLLGFSLPLIIDLNSQTPTEYLKAINALFTEFEQYQNMHPPDGSGTSSLSRARIPSMFKRAASSNKSRRLTDASMGDASTMPPPAPPPPIGALGGAGSSSTSLPTTAGSSNPTMNGLTTLNTNQSNATQNSAPTTPHSAHPTSASSAAEPLLPSESYTHLLTPPLPFDPDFFETFATLCDVLIDCYSRVTQLITSPESLGGSGVALGEMFAKADGRVKKVILGGMMREFEDRAREGLRGEVAGVGNVVLGGLIP